MRDYGKVSPQFWIGRTGRALRGKPEAQIVALYLMTSPHANMIGVYHCPLAYIAHETGLTSEGASKGLLCLIEADFCTYDYENEYVFVHEFAAHQVGDELDPKDKRCQGVANELSKVPKGQCWQSFRARYAVPFHLPVPKQEGSPSEAPSKPLASQEQKQEQEQEQEHSELRSAGKPAKVTDPDEIIFGYGVPLLVKAGSTEKHARSFLGGLRKHHGDAVLIETLRDCLKAKPLQPLDWLAAVLPPKSTAAPKAAPMSFKERETKAKEARFREMAGAAYSSLPGVAPDFIDMETPNVALISG